MEKLKKNLETLKLLCDCKKKVKHNILKRGKKDLILAINECVLNTLNGNVELTKREKEKLEKFKYTLRKLLKKKSIQYKKKILIQEGGFLQVLLPSAISLIGSLLEYFVNKRNEGGKKVDGGTI
jgi:hypothetical protein